MKTTSRDKKGRTYRGLWLASIALMVFALTLPADAALGGDATSVQADQIHMKGTLRMVQSEAYTVQEIRAQTGMVVREYVSPAGKVFGVVWQGPWVPDLQQLLGEYFEHYMQAAQSNRRGHGPLVIQEPGLVVESGGHMRAFVGRAYLPQTVPQGVPADAIR